MTSQLKLQNILSQWIQEHIDFLQQHHLVAIVQFGSTVRGALKKSGDIDLFCIFSHLSTDATDKHKMFSKIEDSLMQYIQPQLSEQLYPSVIARTTQQLDHMAPIYFDMVEFHNILWDPQNTARDLLQKAQQWMQQHGSYKVQKGNLWYWIMDSKVPPGHPADLQFKMEVDGE
ncbi:MAG: nucleotidyltransferase domain-containing protein [Pseudobdellovibrionaceae bacterium]